MFLFTDTARVGETRRTRDGYLVADVRTARIGIQEYVGAEVGKPDLTMVRVYRPEAEVFSDASRASYAHKPMTNGHPPEAVTADTWKRYAVGSIGGDIAKDGDFIRVPMMLADGAAIASVTAGRVELSAGYNCDLDWTAGTASDGQSYDAVQRNIRINHVALVDKGRAGAACRIGDSWAAFDTAGPRDPGHTVQRDPPSNQGSPMKTHMIGDNAVEMSDAAIVAVKGLQAENGRLTADNLKLTGDIGTLKAGHAAAITTKDGEIAEARKAGETKDGEIAALKQQLEDAKLTPQKLDAAVAARGKVIADAKRIAGDKFVADGKTEADIRREVVTARLGDLAKAMSDEAISGAFAGFASQAPTVDHLGRAITASVPGPGQTITADASDAAYAEMCRSYDTAWKRPTQGNA